MKVAQDLLGARAVRAGDVRSADARGRQRALEAVGRVVVELHEFFGRAAPVADVGLVPDLPPPALDFALAVRSRPSGAPTDRRARATCRSPSAGTPSRCRCRCSCRPASRSVGTGAGLVESASGMKPISTSGFILRSTIRVDDAIDDRPVVDRPAVRVFGVGVRRSPLQRRACRRPSSAGCACGRIRGRD